MPHWNSDLHQFNTCVGMGAMMYGFKGIHTILRVNYSRAFNYLYITFNAGQEKNELLVCVKNNGDTLVRLEKYDQYFLRFLIDQQRYLMKRCIHYPLLGKHQLNITPKSLALFNSFYTPPIRTSWHCIQMNDWIYTYPPCEHSRFHALVAGVHWKNATRRKIWLRKYKEFCTQVSFYPYFWKNLVYYLY